MKREERRGLGAVAQLARPASLAAGGKLSLMDASCAESARRADVSQRGRLFEPRLRRAAAGCPRVRRRVRRTKSFSVVTSSAPSSFRASISTGAISAAAEVVVIGKGHGYPPIRRRACASVVEEFLAAGRCRQTPPAARPRSPPPSRGTRLARNTGPPIARQLGRSVANEHDGVGACKSLRERFAQRARRAGCGHCRSPSRRRRRRWRDPSRAGNSGGRHPSR